MAQILLDLSCRRPGLCSKPAIVVGLVISRFLHEMEVMDYGLNTGDVCH